MSKTKKDIDSFAGLFENIESQKEEKKTHEHNTKESKENLLVRKSGRPKLNREKKERFTFTLHRSVLEEATKKAADNGYDSASMLVEHLLKKYTYE